MRSYFIPEVVEPDSGLVVGEAYAFDEDHRLGKGGLGTVFKVTDGQLADALVSADGHHVDACCVKFLNRGFPITREGEAPNAHAVQYRESLLHAAREEYDEYVRAQGAWGHAPRAYALGHVLRGGRDASFAHYAMIMDFVEGMSLRQALPLLAADQRGSLSATQVAEIGLQLCEAVHDLHKRNVTHRDLQPSNVMVTVDRARRRVTSLRLVDLGQSTTPDQDVTATNDASRLATVYFGAPEMFAKWADKELYAKRNEHKVDMWGVGALLYWMRTGERPPLGNWEAGDGYNKLVEIKRMGVTLPTAYQDAGDETLRVAIENCMQYDTDDRFDETYVRSRLSKIVKNAVEADEVTASDDATPTADARELYEQALAEDRKGNKAAAARLYQQAADQGHVRAMNNLALLYEYGRGVDEDMPRALELYRKAADQGYAVAQTNLAWLLEGNEGVDADLREAARLYSLAAEQGNARAQNNLAWMLLEGRGYDKETGQPVSKEAGLPLAVELYRKAASQGYAKAQRSLGYHYDMGLGVKEDKVEAERWYRKAADQGDSAALNNLGLFYKNGQGGLRQDLAKARELFERAIEAGSKVAVDNLKKLEEMEAKAAEEANTEPTAKELNSQARAAKKAGDYETAVSLFRQAAELGHAGAQCNLGYAYSVGQGVAQDRTEALKWYRKSADQGNIHALNNLGYYYRKGLGGLEQDLVKAREYIEKAIAGGNEHARDNLKKLEEMEIEAEIAKVDAEIAAYGAGPGVASVAPSSGVDSAPSSRASRRYVGVMRNELCPCGSGKKYKNCHGRVELGQAAAQTAEARAKEARLLYMQALNYEGGYGVYQDHAKAVELMHQAADKGNFDAREWLKRHGEA